MVRASLCRCAAAMLISLAGLPAQAQDEVVPAHEEPRHVPKLVNEWVRIVDVEIPEGEQTLYHRHSVDYPYVLVSSVTLYNQVHGKEPQDSKMERGFVGYYDVNAKGAYTHRFINRGPGVFRAIGIELMKPVPPEGKPGLPGIPGVEKVLDNNRVGAYRIKLAPGASSGPIVLPGPSVRVSVGSGRVRDKVAGSGESTLDLSPALFQFRDAAVTTTITNIGSQDIELVEIVLK
jgi:hypothetical protein